MTEAPRDGPSDAPARSRRGHSGLVDAHVHFWDTGALHYPWLHDLPALDQPRLPADYPFNEDLGGGATVEQVVVVEANPRTDQGLDEVRFLEGIAAGESRIAAVVAFVDLASPASGWALDRLAEYPRVRGVRHNIQGTPPGFCLQRHFVAGVRQLGKLGYGFDLCVTHDQLPQAVELVRRCPDTRFVLDHCGKPPIRSGAFDPWASGITELAALENVWCKLSGLLTEADPLHWTERDLVPYALHVVDRFGPGRLIYGSDWPVLTLARRPGDWYTFTRFLTQRWAGDERRALYGENARSFYHF
jgi:L-fuconolactonase